MSRTTDKVIEQMNGDRLAVVCTNSWAGRKEQACIVVGETPKRYRIACAVPITLPPRFKTLHPGETALVPKYSIRFTD